MSRAAARMVATCPLIQAHVVAAGADVRGSITNLRSAAPVVLSERALVPVYDD
jgi:hypothetical protein